MEKKQSAMQELIERLIKLQNKGYDDAGIRTGIQIATELLQKERDQIEKAYEAGFYSGCDQPMLDSMLSKYFTQTYNQ